MRFIGVPLTKSKAILVSCLMKSSFGRPWLYLFPYFICGIFCICEHFPMFHSFLNVQKNTCWSAGNSFVLLYFFRPTTECLCCTASPACWTTKFHLSLISLCATPPVYIHLFLRKTLLPEPTYSICVLNGPKGGFVILGHVPTLVGTDLPAATPRRI